MRRAHAVPGQGQARGSGAGVGAPFESFIQLRLCHNAWHALTTETWALLLYGFANRRIYERGSIANRRIYGRNSISVVERGRHLIPSRLRCTSDRVKFSSNCPRAELSLFESSSSRVGCLSLGNSIPYQGRCWPLLSLACLRRCWPRLLACGGVGLSCRLLAYGGVGLACSLACRLLACLATVSVFASPRVALRSRRPRATLACPA